jgi:hypothetical protein
MADPYFSEIKYLGGASLDFIEVAVDVGADVSDLVVTIYLSNGNVRTTNALDGLTPTTIGGQDVYVINTATSGSFNGLGKTNGLSLSDDTTVYSFFSFDDLASPITANSGAASGLTSTQIGMAGSGQSLETGDDGASYSTQGVPNPGSVACLTSGTNISTAIGEVKVETLKPGALVLNNEGERLCLLAAFSRTLTRSQLCENPKLFPVRICAGALGNELPHRDLLVSRQHRLMVSSAIAKRMFGSAEVLVSAIHLVKLPGIFIDTTVESVAYFHLLFSAHEIIFAEGAPTESLFLGDEAINALSDDARSEIALIFPDQLPKKLEVIPSRPIPEGKKQKQLIARHASNQKALLM